MKCCENIAQVLLVDLGFRKPLGCGRILRPRMENLTDINVFSSVCAEREREIKQSLSRRDCRLSANKSVRFLAGFSSLAAKATRGSVLIAKFVINWLGESRVRLLPHNSSKTDVATMLTPREPLLLSHY